MPSEERVEIAFKALFAPIEKYRSAIATTAEEVRGFLATHRGDDASDDIAIAAELGGFAAGRIDMDRFANLVSESREEEDPDTIRKVEKAFDVFRKITSDGDDQFYLKLKPGTRLRDAVAGRLSEIGRGFAAARIVRLAALGALTDGQADDLLEPLGFEAWNTGERQHSPPLVVELDGAALNAADLVDFLDGNVRIVLLVNGDAPPAPLVRLITPSAFVLQTTDAKDLDRFGAAEPPAVAALMPPGAACFVHDPSRGDHLGERLEIFALPEKPPRRKLGGTSGRQQKEELEQLRALAQLTGTETARSSLAPATEAKSVDKLAAWLLAQTDLSNISEIHSGE